MVRTYEEAGVSQDEKSAHIAALVSALRYRRRGLGKPLTKKVVIATPEELESNGRARSAKLRVWEKSHGN